MKRTFNARFTLIASIVSGITASICCVGPLVLLMLGVSGVWIAHLTLLEPYQPIFVGLTLGFIGLTFYKLYRAPACQLDAQCERSQSIQRRVFWLVSVILLILLLLPWLGPFFID